LEVAEREDDGMARLRDRSETANAVYSSGLLARKSVLRIPNRYDVRGFESRSTGILKFQISNNLGFSRRIFELKTSRNGFKLTSVVNSAFLKAPRIVNVIDPCS
jgi:hypothetical protein